MRGCCLTTYISKPYKFSGQLCSMVHKKRDNPSVISIYYFEQNKYKKTFRTRKTMLRISAKRNYDEELVCISQEIISFRVIRTEILKYRYRSISAMMSTDSYSYKRRTIPYMMHAKAIALIRSLHCKLVGESHCYMSCV
jgi:hypothetical protein